MKRRKSGSDLPNNHRPLQTDQLEPLEPSEGLRRYLEQKAEESASATIASHKARINWFIRWCEEEEISNLNDLTGRDFHEFRIWRCKGSDLRRTTVKSLMDTLRVFIRFLERINAVKPKLSEKVHSPSLEEGEDVREEMVDHERAERILDYLDRYEYASLPHVVLLLIAKTGIRIGTLHALDLEDVHLDCSDPHLTPQHRPSETPLKNKTKGERHIHIGDTIVSALKDYIHDLRIQKVDEFGRNPLLTTKNGRMAKSTIRTRVYQWTRPCVLRRECPHEVEVDSCSAANHANEACKCPSSTSPHSFRRGYLTHELKQGIPVPILSDRADVTESVLREHYDQRDDEQQMEQRKEIIQAAHQEGSDYGG